MADGHPVRVLIAPDKFAGTLTAAAAARAVGVGWGDARSDDVLDLAPMSDGGPGFVECLTQALGGSIVAVRSAGPLGQPVVAELLVVRRDGSTEVYVESAQVVGLAVAGRRDPWRATTAGLAPVLRAALDHHPDRVVVGVGGTATTDGGRGLAEAFGAWPADVELVAAVDVLAPLLGAHGAAHGFARQKGADDAMVERLETRLRGWASASAMDPSRPGAGAGGGLGFGLQLLGATTVVGAELVATATGLGQRVAASALVLTGEGRFDGSSLQGKVVGSVASLGLVHGRPCLVLAGQAEVPTSSARAAGVDEVHTVAELLGSVEAAVAHPVAGLAALARQVAVRWPRP